VKAAERAHAGTPCTVMGSAEPVSDGEPVMSVSKKSAELRLPGTDVPKTDRGTKPHHHSGEEARGSLGHLIGEERIRQARA
jgi:hypothetical protein